MSDESQKDKEVAWYASIVQAWIDSRFELDRSILLLSSGAVGLLVSLVTKGEAQALREIILYFLALLWFLISIISVLIALSLNGKFLVQLKNGDFKDDALLGAIDKISAASFFIGIVLAVVASGLTVRRNFLKSSMEVRMAEEKRVEGLRESMNGLGALRPDTKSLNGLANMRPAVSKPQPPPPPPSNPVPESKK